MPRFEQTSCSQCGQDFGPGNSGYSHCDQHETNRDKTIRKLIGWQIKEHGWTEEEAGQTSAALYDEIIELEMSELRAALGALSKAFDHMLFNSPGEREYDAQREAERLLGQL